MKLRKLGTTSVSGKFPTLYETDTGDIVVQGYRLVDAEALAQLENVLPNEAAVVVPRELMVRFAPKDNGVREYVSDDEFTDLFRAYRYTAWRLETRSWYGNVGEDKPFQEWLAGKDPGIEWLKPWLTMVREELAKGSGWRGCGLLTIRPQTTCVGSCGRHLEISQQARISATYPGNIRWSRNSPTRISGSLTVA